MTPTPDKQIRSLVESFVRDLTSLVRDSALDSVQQVLGAGRAGPGRKRGRPAKKTRRAGRPAGSRKGRKGRRAKRSTAEVEAMAASVLSHVKKNADQGIEQIAKALRRPSKVLKLPIAKLLAGKQIRKTGAKRGTRYHPR